MPSVEGSDTHRSCRGRRTAPLGAALLACWLPLAAVAESARLAVLDDIAQLAELSELRATAGGEGVLYTVTRPSSTDDVQQRELWLANSAERTPRLLLGGDQAFSQARSIPGDQGYSFLRDDHETRQLWVVRDGSAPRRLSQLPGRILDYEWAPDGKQVLIAYDSEAARPASQPLVIDRLEFKRDGQGYLSGAEPSLYVFDPAGGRLHRVAGDGQASPGSARWSPDGRWIAFIASAEPGVNARRSETLFVVDSKGEKPPRTLAPARLGSATSLAWAPDGRSIAYLDSEERDLDFREHPHLSLVELDSGAVRSLTKTLDQFVSTPAFSSDGKRVSFMVSGDRSQGLAEVTLADGKVSRLLDGPLTVSDYAVTSTGILYIASGDERPGELYRLIPGSSSLPRQSISGIHDALNRQVRWLAAKDVEFSSSDGQIVHGLLTLPGGKPSHTLPALLRIHGGPNSQDSHSFVFERQLLAAQGYAVLNVNYRGSSGRSTDFSKALTGEWGKLPVADLLAGVEYLVSSGIADPQRLGVGGWSFGGILTDYLIAADTRFKAAISGAGSGNRIAQYGHDQWLSFWRAEFPDPWLAPQAWIDASWPFFHAGQIRTPTLFMGGDRDWSVPLVGSEQMYQALKVNGVPTQLVIYPGEGHVLRRPSFVRDRLQRTIDWYAQWLR
ncbi:alpha/beta hydrolase family protein [Pseudomonas sp. PDM23]|uniref:S9 family peptidase n=1 Tax=Pseudomonas sp. PDM23 TaxID=2769275 RepID=UPI0017867869|nr:S9 family peptidase [Pseudomonas sp. PDM23]